MLAWAWKALYDTTCASCRLAEEQKVGAIVNLQEDTDMAFFDLDLAPIRERCLARGDVAHNRYPIRDFDPFDLRMKLAGAVQLVADQIKVLKGSGKKVYIHCTAGEPFLAVSVVLLASTLAFGPIKANVNSKLSTLMLRRLYGAQVPASGASGNVRRCRHSTLPVPCLQIRFRMDVGAL